MKKTVKKTLLTVLVAATAAFAVAGCSSGTDNNSSGNGSAIVSDDKLAPDINVSGVPSACNVGDKITLPAATASDNVDGDVSPNIKVTVSLLKADGETVSRDLIYEKAGNVPQSFTVTSNILLKYKIEYTCRDSAGNKARALFFLNATEDNQTGELTINENSVPNFTLESGINSTAGEGIVLPSATAIDQPNDVDISSRIEVRIYEKVAGETSSVIFANYSDFKQTKSVDLPVGEYEAVYTVKDVAGNVFPTTYAIPVYVTMPIGINLARNKDNFVLDNQEGMSWVNEYGEISFGNTSARASLEQTVGFTEKVAKIHEQYVGISFNADTPGKNGQSFYSISARGSKDRTTLPNTTTCAWPSYLFLRIEKNKIVSRIEKTSDAQMEAIREYNGALLDGKDHTLYVQWLNVGASADADDAAIMLYGWVDKTPAVGHENADFIYKAAAGKSFATGTLTQEVFEELWNSTGAGWFAMDSFGMNRPYGDDHMRIKGFALYEKDETDFATDIEAPVIESKFKNDSILALGEDTIIPIGSVEGADSIKSYVVDSRGNRTEIVGGIYRPAEKGEYRLLYEAYDEAGNYGYKVFDFTVAKRDGVAPVLTIGGESVLGGTVGQPLKLPEATATDNEDGDLTSKITVEVIGGEYATGFAPGDTYVPMTAGTQKIIYTIVDSFANVTRKEIIVNVASKAGAGNILSSALTVTNGYGGLASQEYIYEQKVSMILNISNLDDIIMFNVRGPVTNYSWPQGLVIRFLGGRIDVSAAEHDGAIYGSAAVNWADYLNRDVVFEYQFKTVVIGGEEYLRTQMWLDGQLLTFIPDEMNSGLIGLENGVSALYRRISDFMDAQSGNIYSSPFWVACYNASVTIKELRIDGTSCVIG